MNSPQTQLEEMLAQLDARIHAQNASPATGNAPARKAPENEGQLYFVSENVERRIDDMRGILRTPQMVLDDDKGWTPVGWEY